MKNSKVKLILLRGNSGSGKSSVATLIRHQSKPNCNEFGENEMRSWWRDRDLIGTIPETCIPETMSLEETVEMIVSDVLDM